MAPFSCVSSVSWFRHRNRAFPRIPSSGKWGHPASMFGVAFRGTTLSSPNSASIFTTTYYSINDYVPSRHMAKMASFVTSRASHRSSPLNLGFASANSFARTSTLHQSALAGCAGTGDRATSGSPGAVSRARSRSSRREAPLVLYNTRATCALSAMGIPRVKCRLFAICGFCRSRR